ncbi:hypothetical protein BDV96DRAFT_639498 [Lophiotrema nucula]|uniref:CPAF-like PDZ domain-containing protein n=1 Tax=Lophiotrema nucula TaxID=690887 RepID=A0A6A5ZVF4_9PLEO|nr:hypothetical protein BDV96DRAFT_639498 [Lophiotrema nucula]
MSFVIFFTALCLLFVNGLSKPFNVGAAKRQDATPTTGANAPLSTICGDIVEASHNDYVIFYASDAYACLQSVPFNAAVATRFIEYWNDTLQFQSTLAYMKDPPEGYQQPAVDVMEVLQSIQNNVTAGVYTNQYAFEADIQLLINRMHDAHVVLNAGVLQPFFFASPYGLISASVDGNSVPEIFIADDVIRCQRLGCTPSPITHINGVEVIDYLTQYGELNSAGYLEPHADWNALMESPARDVQGGLSIFQSGTFYPGDSLNFTFKDQEPVDTYWLSIFSEQEDTGPLTTGGDFYNYFVLGFLPASYNPEVQWWTTYPPDNSSSNSNSSDYPPANCSASTSESWCSYSEGGYPDNPTVAQNDLSILGGGVVTGYIYDDISTGVLSIPTFDQYGNNTEYFQDAVQYFITNATARNTSRIIIDLQQNSGGTVFLAINTFKSFFYAIDPYAASRIRNHDIANILGSAYTQWWEDLESNPDGNDGANRENYGYYAASEWVATNRINPATGTNFSSWEEFAGPVNDRGDKFSLPQRYNLSDEVFDASAFDNWVPLGYGISQAPDYPQLWAPENVVILTDGLCSSSCALFVELMTHQAGVRTIAAGGRPVKGPMQAASGSRGAHVYSADALDDDFDSVNYFVDNQTAYSLLPNRTDTGIWVTYAGFTIRDQVRQNDDVPLQFKYEAADCRIYYTLANVYNFTRLWHDVATAAWFDSSLCVEDSTGYPTARNTSNTKPPPASTAQTPNLNFDLEQVNLVDFSVNSTGGLSDLPIKRKPGEIVPCPSSHQCGGSSLCKVIGVHCSFTGYTSVYACVPPCTVGNGKDSCLGVNTFCDPDVAADSKQNAFTRNGKNTPFHAIVQQGHCKPSSQASNTRLCPK